MRAITSWDDTTTKLTENINGTHNQTFTFVFTYFGVKQFNGK